MNMKIRLKASVIDLTLTERYRLSASDGRFTADDGEEYELEKLEEICTETVESAVTGEYENKDGRITVSYTESPEFGYSCLTSLIFDDSDRGALTLVRAGEVSAVFRFDLRERRQRCSYETPLMPVEFTVNTRRLHNTVGEGGGAILIDYTLEIRGVNTERNRIFIEVRPI